MAGDTKDFAALIEDAQRLPTSKLNSPREITSPFAVPLPADHRVVDTLNSTKVPGAVEYDYEAHVEVLCVNREEERNHYVEILNKVLNGDALLRYEDRSVTKEGDSLITICWLTRKPRMVKRVGNDREV